MPKHYSFIGVYEVSAKKGDSQILRLAVTQHHPYPRISARAGRIEWDNLDTLNPDEYQNHKGPHLEETYYVAHVRRDFDPDRTAGDRRDHAGYESEECTIVYRGNNLGEITAYVSKALGSLNICWKVRGYENPTDSERSWLNEQVGDRLLRDIRAHLDILRSHAIANLKERIQQELKESRKELDEAEDTMRAIIAKL